jgi:hypothetical protein
MNLHDDLVDISLMVRGLRTAEEAGAGRSFTVGKLRTAIDVVRQLRPNRRRMPDLEQALDWAYRSVVDAPLSEKVGVR